MPAATTPYADEEGREPKLPACGMLELAERVAVVAEKCPVVTEDQHAHQVEPDRAIAGVEVLGEVGCRQSLEGAAVENFLGEALAAVPTELTADEDQVVLFAGDEVAAVRPPFFEDIEPLRDRKSVV